MDKPTLTHLTPEEVEALLLVHRILTRVADQRRREKNGEETNDRKP